MEQHAIVSESMNNSRTIPHDVMLEILSRVPGRSLVRFRCVCKLWNSLFHDSRFISRQLNHAAKNLFFCLSYVRQDDKVALYSFEIEAGKAVFGNKFTVPVYFESFFRMTNSCNGLIAFHGCYFAYVANPCTREWMALPEFSLHCGDGSYRGMRPNFGLGFSTVTGEYKLVRFVRYDNGWWWCEVLTIGTDSSWRLLGEMPYPVTEFDPVYENGYLYWTIGGEDDQFVECILAFDVSREVFMMISPPERHPEPYGDGSHWFMSVLEGGGSVCLIDWRMFVDDKKLSYSAVMHTHVLKDHADCRWSKSHSIWLSRMKLLPTRHFDAYKVVNNVFPIAIQNDKVLLYHPFQSWRLHDLHTGTCSKIDLSHLKELTCKGLKRKKKELVWTSTCSRPFACAESIVRITN